MEEVRGKMEVSLKSQTLFAVPCKAQRSEICTCQQCSQNFLPDGRDVVLCPPRQQARGQKDAEQKSQLPCKPKLRLRKNDPDRAVRNDIFNWFTNDFGRPTGLTMQCPKGSTRPC